MATALFALPCFYQTHPRPVRPELVEGPFFFSTPDKKKERCFDRLSTNGVGASRSNDRDDAGDLSHGFSA